MASALVPPAAAYSLSTMLSLKPLEGACENPCQGPPLLCPLPAAPPGLPSPWDKNQSPQQRTRSYTTCAVASAASPPPCSLCFSHMCLLTVPAPGPLHVLVLLPPPGMLSLSGMTETLFRSLCNVTSSKRKGFEVAVWLLSPRFYHHLPYLISQRPQDLLARLEPPLIVQESLTSFGNPHGSLPIAIS